MANTTVMDSEVESEAPAAPRKPLLLKVTLVLLTLVLIASLGAVAWLQQERERLEAELTAQHMRILELREELTRAEVRLQEREAALNTRDVALAEANKPVIPVRVTFRPAWMGQGLVATIRNTTDEPLNVIAEFRVPGSDKMKDFALALAPKDVAEIGHAAGGWTITSGQSVTVSASGYKSLTAFAP